jgi:hypothetical protein
MEESIGIGCFSGKPHQPVQIFTATPTKTPAQPTQPSARPMDNGHGSGITVFSLIGQILNPWIIV